MIREDNVKDDPWLLLNDKKILDDEIKSLIVEKYGEKGKKAIEAIDSRRVKRYKDFYVVVGREEHIVVEDYCNCKDFFFNASRKGEYCWHILAVKIADITECYDRIDGWYHEIERIL